MDAEGTSYVTDATAAALFVFSPDGSMRELLSLTRDGIPAAPLHVAVGPTGTLEAEHEAQATTDWATCPPVTVRDPLSEALRSQRDNAGEIATRVTIKATAATATSSRVAIRALSVGDYVNSFTGTPQQSACRSTGVLEQELLTAMRNGGA